MCACENKKYTIALLLFFFGRQLVKTEVESREMHISNYTKILS